jgi:hypothetical protein
LSPALTGWHRNSLFIFRVSRQPQCSQAVHVFDDGPLASHLLPKRVIDFSFPSLTAIEYTLCSGTRLCVTHNSPLFFFL